MLQLDRGELVKRLVKIVLIELLIILILLSFLIYKWDIFDIASKKAFFIKSQVQTREISVKGSKLYVELEKALLETKDQLELRDLSLLKKPQEIFNILEMISNDKPEIMYYRGAEYRFGKLKLLYTKSKEEIEEHRERIRVIREDFISNYIKEDMTDYEKLLVTHDYIVNNSRYDDRLFHDSMLPPESYSSYGVLALGIGVCEGYAKAMKYILDDLGMRSIIVVGESMGENHAWNLVELDGDYYHIDSTWDDPVTDNGKDILRYNYFNLDDESLSKTHRWDKDDYPRANGRIYNYFTYNNLLVSSSIELEQKLREAILKKATGLSLKFEGFDGQTQLNNMIETIAYDNYEIIRLKGYSYSIDDEHEIISFEFYY